MKYLIIVESFAKTKTITKYLTHIDKENEYIVTASSGHICDLSKNDLGFTTDTWEASYVLTKENIVKKIRDFTKISDVVYFATDPDTEGEAIAYHIKNNITDLLKNKKSYRIKFNEITKDAIEKSLKNPLEIDYNLVNAQETRRILDRLIGFKLSPMLWKKFDNFKLSAGRVQSVALKICIDMLNNINDTELNPYWIILAKFKFCAKKFDCKLYNDNNIIKFKDVNNIKTLFKNLIFDNNWSINYIEKKSSISPPPPYTTTSLQQDAYNKLRISSKKTMEIAQILYEKGYITYMRTDSTNISQDAKYNIISYIKENFGNDHVKNRTYKTKILNAQEAHEAIRITKSNNIDINYEGITEEHKKIYNLIWRRTISCLMINSEYNDIDIIISNNNIDPYKFICKKSLLIKEGFLKILSPNSSIDNTDELYDIIKNIKSNKSSIIPIEFIADGNITDPPSMYNEITLIKELEKEGIGRPSTYSSIIDKLYSKGYVSKGTNPQKKINVETFIKTKDKLDTVKKVVQIGGKNKDLLIPTEIGININNYLSNLVPFIIDIKFTAYMEEALDLISLNKTSKVDTLNIFYNKMKPFIEEVTTNIKKFSKDHKSDFIKSKYGYCYYNSENKIYTNIEPYLNFKKITIDELSELDKKFIISLPKNVPNTIYKIYLGKYGLYLKDNKNNNLKLDKNKWDSAINNTLVL